MQLSHIIEHIELFFYSIGVARDFEFIVKREVVVVDSSRLSCATHGDQ